MNSWKVILATMAIFGAGVITGGLVVKYAAVPVKNRAARYAVAVTNTPALNVIPGQLQRMEFLLRARKELALTPQQHDRIEKIIREGQDRSRKIWEGVAPEMRKELQSVHEKIRAELTPEQGRRFEQLLKNTTRSNPGTSEGGSPERQRDRMRQGKPGDGPIDVNSPTLHPDHWVPPVNPAPPPTGSPEPLQPTAP